MTTTGSKTEKNGNPAKIIVGILWFLLFVMIDQLTKSIVYNGIRVKGPFVLIEDVFEFHYLENTGAAWGMLSGAIVVFALLALAILVILGFCYMKMPWEKRYIPLRIDLILIAAGAMGNLLDRIFRGYVVDFFYFKLIDFPIFNVADIYITVGAIMLAILIIFYYKDQDLDFLKKKKETE